MTFERRKPQPGNRIPPEAVQLFHKLAAIQAKGDDRILEKYGGRMNEWNADSYRLCDLMRVDRWQAHPLECSAPLPPDWIAANDYKLKCYQAGHAAYCALERESRR